MSWFLMVYIVIGVVTAIAAWIILAVFFSEDDLVTMVIFSLTVGLLLAALVGILWPLALLALGIYHLMERI